MFLPLAALLSVCVLVLASPIPDKRQSITTLSTAEISAFKPFSFYAAAAYCQPSTTLAWNCGANCQANPTFKPVASGGDGDAVQFWYVGYDPTLDTVIVGHQGTDFSKINAVITDAEFVPEPLDSSLFPGVPSSVKAHSGFRDEQAKTATQVLAAVQKTLSDNSASQVTVVGHSLGGALALLDGVYLRLQLPNDTDVKVINYGSPRVGNPDFANFVDSKIPLNRITNKKDLVPILPGRSVPGPPFAHPNGELHIEDDDTWGSCPGHDNTDKKCSVGEVPNVFEGEPNDHSGPYDGVHIGGC
ncbi:alpha/beta-hydrolase [Marasmius fiardii PR-910]|nr:alpha/beta-hydrolase [Marasmius fiardii PR-910]